MPPMCTNSKCKNHKTNVQDSVTKVKNKKNKYQCVECKTEFSWSMPKKIKGIIY